MKKKKALKSPYQTMKSLYKWSVKNLQKTVQTRLKKPCTKSFYKYIFKEEATITMSGFHEDPLQNYNTKGKITLKSINQVLKVH